jgi:hypothetical protein
VTAQDGYALWVVPDLTSPVDDEGPLRALAQALRALAPARAVTLDARTAPGRPGAEAALRRAALAVLARARGDAAPPPPTGAFETAVTTGAPADHTGRTIAVDPARLRWLSEHFVLFDEAGPPRELIVDHVTAELDPRLVLEAEPALLLPALTGHGVPDRPVWRDERLDRTLRDAGLLGRWCAADGVGLALVEPGRRHELEAALAEHGLRPAACVLGGPGVEVGP